MIWILLVLFFLVSTFFAGLIALYVTYFLWSLLLGRHMANLGMGSLATITVLHQVKKFISKK